MEILVIPVIIILSIFVCIVFVWAIYAGIEQYKNERDHKHTF